VNTTMYYFLTHLICMLIAGPNGVLIHPEPCDLWVDEVTGETLNPPPVPDSAVAEGMPAFGILRRDGVEVYNVGVGGLFVNRHDFDSFTSYVEENILSVERDKAKQYAEKIKAWSKGGIQRKPHVHLPFSPTSLALDFGISLLWPNQTFASITLFRGRTNRRLGEFHHARFRALAGQLNLYYYFFFNDMCVPDYVHLLMSFPPVERSMKCCVN
jgi:hypothetical protein